MNTEQANHKAEYPGGANAPGGNNVKATWPVNYHNLRSNIAHMRADAQQLVLDCYLWALKRDISKPEFAAAVGSSDNYIYKIITGRATNPDTGERIDLSRKLETAMRKWLRQQKAAQQKRSAFLRTPTAERVLYACELARESRTPVMLYGPSHIGKTWALEHDAETHNHGRTHLIRMQAKGGFGGMLHTIGEVLGYRGKAPLQDRRDNIYRALDREMTLLFDEVHQLLHTYHRQSFIECMEFIREIYDRLECPMVLSVTNFGRDKLVEDRKADLEQLFRRGVHRIQLGTADGSPLQADLEIILREHGLDFPSKADQVHLDKRTTIDLRDTLRQLAKEDGLKSITERIRYAGKLAARAGREHEITWEDWARAHAIIAANAHPQPNWK